MKKFHQPIKDIITHYAQKLEHPKILDMVASGISSREEAQAMLQFLDAMCDQVKEDADNRVVVLSQPIHTTDAEKVCSVVEDYIEELGFGGPLD